MNETPMAIPRSTPKTVDTVDRNVSPPLFLKTPLHKKLHAISKGFQLLLLDPSALCRD
jgi:hypothetical protein